MDLLTPLLPEDYYWTMAGRNRLLMVSHEEKPSLFCTFFVLPSLKEVTHYYCRPPLTTPPDLEHGPIIYIDTIVGQGFTKEVFQQIEACLVERVPDYQIGVWYKSTGGRDRRTLYTRRLGCLVS